MCHTYSILQNPCTPWYGQYIWAAFTGIALIVIAWGVLHYYRSEWA